MTAMTKGQKKWSAKNAFLFALFSRATLHMCKLMAFVLLEKRTTGPRTTLFLINTVNKESFLNRIVLSKFRSCGMICKP